MFRSDWQIAGYNRQTAVSLVHRGLNPLLAVLLAARQISGEEDLRRLLAEDASIIYDPFLMKDMDRAVARLQAAIAAGEHIAVHGDYDVDGLTSSCLVTDYFRSKGLRCDVYIPERCQGYGVKTAALDRLHAAGVSLLITTDCGITALEEAAYAKSLGIDMVITDHHECKGTLPEAAAVIDPKRHDCPYPNKALAGVGVAFKLICAMEGPGQTDALMEKYGDLLALGTIADVMPVVGENRAFIRRGIRTMQHSHRPGLRELAAASGFSDLQTINANCMGYVLAPRLNAAGRMGKIHYALDLLLTEEQKTAETLADTLCELNRNRQQLVNDMFQDAMEMLRQTPPENLPIVIASDRWHQGVAGIVASRLAEHFLLPVMVICIENGKGRASCRSFASFNLFAALERCHDLLDHFGGHEMAAGFSIPAENIPAFRQRMCSIFEETAAAAEKPALQIDFEVIKPGLLTVENVDALSLLEPYGAGNPMPLLCMREVQVLSVTPLSGGQHTKLVIRKNGETFPCLFFSKSERDIGAKPGCMAHIAFTPQVNTFRGQKSVQFLLSDVVIDNSGKKC